MGRDPQRVTGPALILFPLLPATLCCGLAGILTLRRKVEAGSREAICPFVRAGGGKEPVALLDGRIAAAEYLGGKSSLEAMERELLRMKGEEAFRRIFFTDGEARRLTVLSAKMKAFLADEERLLEEQAGWISTADLEAVNRGLVLLRDLVWGLEQDILDNIGRIAAWPGRSVADVAPEALPKYRKMNFLLNCLDRLEVRGRDSAGIQISFVAADAGAVGEIMTGLREGGLGEELGPADGGGGSCRRFDHLLSGGRPRGMAAGGRSISFTYKTAEIIGELGRNVRELRSQDRARTACSMPLPVSRSPSRPPSPTPAGRPSDRSRRRTAIPSEISPSPDGCAVRRRSRRRHYPAYGTGPWTIHVVLNGDIDNYQTLREALEAEGMPIAPEVTTDTKIIPLQIEKYLLAGHDLTEAFRRAVGDFEGSHAIAMISNVEPGKIFLALKGSGQSIYVGITPDRYLFSSELYGLVEETPFFIKMDGEKPARPEQPETTGQIVILDQDAPGGGGRHPGALL